VVVLVAALVIFGPKRLTEIGRASGQTIRSFKKGIREIDEPDEVPALPVVDQTVHSSVAAGGVAGNAAGVQAGADPRAR
jgi:sec-independent protein translocase protein TatA